MRPARLVGHLTACIQSKLSPMQFARLSSRALSRVGIQPVLQQEGNTTLADSGTANPTVLIVEDDVDLAEEMAFALRHSHLNPVVATDWDQAMDAIAAGASDVVVLDQRLGSVDAVPRLPLLRVLIQAPILVLTANRAEADRILALETGADDFLIKPISGRELVAKVRAHLRRAAAVETGVDTAVGGRPRWRLSQASRGLVRPDGTPVSLTGAEFELLTQLIETPNRTISRDALARRVLGRAWRPEDRAVDTLVLRLRQKLGSGGERTIVTIRNQGYAFTAFPDTLAP